MFSVCSCVHAFVLIFGCLCILTVTFASLEVLRIHVYLRVCALLRTGQFMTFSND